MSKSSIALLAIGLMVAGGSLILGESWLMAGGYFAIWVVVAAYNNYRDRRYRNRLINQGADTVLNKLKQLKKQDDHLRGNPNDN